MSVARAASCAGLSLLVFSCVSCGGDTTPMLPVGPPTPVTYFTSQTTDTRFHTADHFLASMEMQISGEPFAQLLGRNLASYDRFSKVTDLYTDPATGLPLVDPLSYSIAIESYEYSKQPMNNTSFESGAGLALQFGPVLNPTGVTGDAAFTLLLDRLQLLAAESDTAGSPNRNWVISPAPTDNPLDVYGWPGYFPIFAEFKSFATDISPSAGATRSCTINGGYLATANGPQAVGDYECGYNSLNLPLRDVQVEKVLEPAALGFALWKQGLWTINYWQSLHDVVGNGITDVNEADLPLVGQPANNVIGRFPDPSDPTGQAMVDGTAGVYLGDIPLEGWQGLTMLEEMHNKSAMTLTRLLTTDGTALGGFPTTKAALDYDYTSPLRWWPSAIGVTELSTPPLNGYSWKYFPQPTAFTIQAPESRLRGLAALAGGFAEYFALTDFNNDQVGGLPSSRATFDGDPFPADNQLADGEDTPHDRALANIKVALVDIDRLHWDATNKVLCDTATVTAGVATPGSTVTTVDAAYTILGMRTALRSISSSLTLYSNDTPDTLGLSTALDATSLAGAPAPLPARVVALITAQADFMVAKLINSDGAVANFYDLAKHAPDPAPTQLESEASAIRGLLEAYLVTDNTKYALAAQRVWADLDARFWMKDVRAYRTTAGVSDTLTFTPVAFGTIQGAMRQYWKLVANQPGNERLASEILERVQRMNKLVANGWDDANADNKVQFPDECAGAGLQMAERALTGELSRVEDDGDRDHDCVMEIAVAKLPAALAGQVVFKRR